MYTLGISCYFHDSSAALLKDGIIVAAVDEERFTRVKHDSRFPINAINFCLECEKIEINHIDQIGFYEKPLLKFERVMAQHVSTFPKGYLAFLGSIPGWITKKMRIRNTIKKKLNYKKDIMFVPHHLSHAASSFIFSPFKKSAILVVDGVGEWSTTTLGIGNKNNIELIKEIKFPNSIGLLYSAITSYLGFRVNNSEFKVMGLAAYGEQNKNKNIFYDKLKKLISINNDGSYTLDMSYFTFMYKTSMVSNKMIKLLDEPVRRKKDPITQKHKNIAAAIQLISEEIIFGLLKELYALTKCDSLTYSGGLALNSVINGKIQQKSPFKKLWIQPNAGDGGGSVGAAAYVYNCVQKNKRTYVQNNTYFGPNFKTKDIENFLDKNNISYTKYSNKSVLIKTVAKHIYDNKIIAWFQGRMEYGPRALGNRSILANPLNKNIKNIVNSRIKFRENFRPFAPVIRFKDIKKFISQSNIDITPTKFMLMVLKFKKKWHHLLPSVVHVDGTGRFQIIDRNINQNYYDLITEFGKISGIPILLNTSLNVKGEPICCSIDDAYNFFVKTDIDYLVLENYLIKKNKII
jgi:carbamoyltransferase